MAHPTKLGLAALLLVAGVLLGGCNSGTPAQTAEQAKAFKGGPPPPGFNLQGKRLNGPPPGAGGK